MTAPGAGGTNVDLPTHGVVESTFADELGGLPPHDGDLAACCAALYAHPAVRWLLGGDLHPGGEASTRRALELLGVGPGERLADLASGTGGSAILAARERGCSVSGIDYSAGLVRGAQVAAEAAGLGDRVGFVAGDVATLPFGDDELDAALCECSLSAFGDQLRVVGEVRRVLRPGGRLALSDVIVDADRLPAALEGVLAMVACIGGARSREGYEELLREAGLRPIAFESRDDDAAALAERVRDRLRGARLLGLHRIQGAPLATAEAIELVETARGAIAAGALGYAIIVAERP